MIALEKACEIAKNFLKAKNLDLINNCKDLGDKFVFGYVNRDRMIFLRVGFFLQ